MPTPQALLDELRLALPTLRHLSEAEHAWEDILSETWEQLLAAAHCMCHFSHSAVPDRLLSAGFATFSRVVAYRNCPH